MGVDLVSLPMLAEQLATPGSRFLERVLTRREQHEAHRSSDQFAHPTGLQRCEADTEGDRSSSARGVPAVEHIGALWAIKEATIKAWSTALFGGAPPLLAEELDWAEIEVVRDHWQRPAVQLHGRVAAEFSRSLAPSSRRTSWHVSTSSDQDFVIAMVTLSGT